MTLTSRLAVVMWMYGALVAGLLIVVAPLFAVYLGTWFVMGREPHLGEAESVLAWLSRLGAIAMISFVARKLTHRPEFGHLSPLAVTVAGVLGFGCGLFLGNLVRDVWGTELVAYLGLPVDSFIDDVAGGVLLAVFGVMVFLATYVSDGGHAGRPAPAA
jgi:hypothetical protein